MYVVLVPLSYFFLINFIYNTNKKTKFVTRAYNAFKNCKVLFILDYHLLDLCILIKPAMRAYSPNIHEKSWEL